MKARCLTAGLLAMAFLSGGCGGSTEPASTGVTPTVLAVVQEPLPVASTCGTNWDDVDMWPGLEAAAPDLAESVRARTLGLAAGNTTSDCNLTVATPLVGAADIGALAVAAFEHEDPDIRLDVLVHESGVQVDGAMLEAVAPEGSLFELVTPRPYITVVTTWVDDGSGETPSTASLIGMRPEFFIASEYIQTIFGNE